MRAPERVWRWILTARPEPRFSVEDAAQATGAAPAAARAACQAGRQAGALVYDRRGWQIRDVHKLLLVWAVRHRPHVVGRLSLAASVSAVEGDMVPHALFSGPSAVKLYRAVLPSDYTEVFVYLDPVEWPALRARYADRLARPAQAASQLVVWARDAWDPDPLPWEQVYVDLWASPHWWAEPFWRYLEQAADLDGQAGLR